MSVPRITEHYRDAVAKTSVKTRHDNFRSWGLSQEWLVGWYFEVNVQRTETKQGRRARLWAQMWEYWKSKS